MDMSRNPGLAAAGKKISTIAIATIASVMGGSRVFTGFKRFVLTNDS